MCPFSPTRHCPHPHPRVWPPISVYLCYQSNSLKPVCFIFAFIISYSEQGGGRVVGHDGRGSGMAFIL